MTTDNPQALPEHAREVIQETVNWLANNKAENLTTQEIDQIREALAALVVEYPTPWRAEHFGDPDPAWEVYRDTTPDGDGECWIDAKMRKQDAERLADILNRRLPDDTRERVAKWARWVLNCEDATNDVEVLTGADYKALAAMHKGDA